VQIERLNGKVRLYEQEKAKGAQKKVPFRLGCGVWSLASVVRHTDDVSIAHRFFWRHTGAK
jgi:hypothetical protein